jgi:hypothetical protein
MPESSQHALASPELRPNDPKLHGARRAHSVVKYLCPGVKWMTRVTQVWSLRDADSVRSVENRIASNFLQTSKTAELLGEHQGQLSGNLGCMNVIGGAVWRQATKGG